MVGKVLLGSTRPSCSRNTTRPARHAAWIRAAAPASVAGRGHAPDSRQRDRVRAGGRACPDAGRRREPRRASRYGHCPRQDVPPRRGRFRSRAPSWRHPPAASARAACGTRLVARLTACLSGAASSSLRVSRRSRASRRNCAYSPASGARRGWRLLRPPALQRSRAVHSARARCASSPSIRSGSPAAPCWRCRA